MKLFHLISWNINFYKTVNKIMTILQECQVKGLQVVHTMTVRPIPSYYLKSNKIYTVYVTEDKCQMTYS